MNIGRIKLTLFLVGLAELVNKLSPLIIIRIGQNRLGIEALGHAQFAITIVELFLPIMTWGFDIFGPYTLKGLKPGEDEWKRRVGQIMGARISLGVLVYGSLLVCLHTVEKFIPYRETVEPLALLMFLSGITATFVHTADQSLSTLARITIGAKLLSLALIAFFIHSPSDTNLYAILTYGVNVAIGACSLLIILRRYGWLRPRWAGMGMTLLASLPFAVNYILAIFVERLENWFAESWGGATAVGALAGPFRLYQGLLFIIIAFSAVFYSEGIAYPERIGRFLRLTVWAMAAFILPMSVGVFFVGEPLLVTLLGGGFSGQGHNLALICTGMFGHSLLIVVGAQALSALGHVKWTNCAYTLAFLIGGFGSWLAMRTTAPNYALLAPALGKTVAGVLLLIFALRVTEGFQELLLSYRGIVLGVVAMTGTLLATPELFWVVRLLLATFVYALVFGGLSRRSLLQILRKRHVESGLNSVLFERGERRRRIALRLCDS